jgi:hypothetical protein
LFLSASAIIRLRQILINVARKRPASGGLTMSNLTRVGGAEAHGQLPLADTVPKPTPDVVITCT